MELFGGIVLIVLTVLVGTAIGLKANKNVRAFKEADHEIFVGQELKNK